jgi:hypothetical protein
MLQSYFINDDRILKRGLNMNIKEKGPKGRWSPRWAVTCQERRHIVGRKNMGRKSSGKTETIEDLYCQVSFISLSMSSRRRSCG